MYLKLEAGMTQTQAREMQTRILADIVRTLVDVPEAVRVQTLEGSQSTIFEVSVAPEDVRRVIGRQGRTADALRELMASWGGKCGRRLLLEVMEPTRRSDEIPGDAGLSVPVKVERRHGGRLEARHGD